MKKVSRSIVVLGLLMSSVLISCSEEDIIDELTGDCLSFREVETYSEALENFNNNPTVENCEAYKAAAISYLNALDDCPFIDDADLEEALRSASESNCED
ncbi:hypothetical protein [Aquimarina sp. 2201CG14-23]|uniref:hypothetical protein n=1 Tax=Aquimarina mycalae TaxID=3040073 RepID=UPI002477F3C5|nr:hypothetical protein [Aquimarina sp. 2201CG14-23]MDH7447060.1 hypothetical protein [Aquimarina sp. 2201CG14-23]